MAKIKREVLVVRDDKDHENFVSCKFDLCVDAEGVFYMRFSEEEIEKLKAANVDMQRGFQRKQGYLFAPSKDELIKKVTDAWKLYLSRELSSECIVIKYAIQTQANYAMNIEKEICPNPSQKWTGMEYPENPNNRWIQGNVPIHASSTEPFGILIYAKPFVKREYKYAYGSVKTEYYPLLDDDDYASRHLQAGYNLSWLDSVPCIAPPDKVDLEEIEYTETTALFFVNMIKSICILNEKLKDFTNPKALLKLINKNVNVLGHG